MWSEWPRRDKPRHHAAVVHVSGDKRTNEQTDRTTLRKAPGDSLITVHNKTFV